MVFEQPTRCRGFILRPAVDVDVPDRPGVGSGKPPDPPLDGFGRLHLGANRDLASQLGPGAHRAAGLDAPRLAAGHPQRSPSRRSMISRRRSKIAPWILCRAKVAKLTFRPGSKDWAACTRAK